MAQEHYKKIEDYIAGSMSKEERDAFEVELSKDETLKAEVSLHRKVASAVNELYDEDTQVFKADLKKIVQDNQPRIRRLNRRTTRQFLALAASIVLVGMIGFLIYQNMFATNNPNELYQAYAELPTTLSQETFLRSDEASTVSTLEEVLGEEFYPAYEQKQFTLALQTLDRAATKYPTVIQDNLSTFHFFKGISNLQLEQYATAIEALDKVQIGDYTEQALWFKALALLKTEGFSTSSKLAFQAVAETLNPKQQEALKILSEFSD